jgi:ligand-binding sensor domain-containing protein
LKSVNSLVINDNNIFAGTIDGEIFHSTNNGKIWTAVDSGLKNVTYVITLTVCNNTIFAGTSTGVFLSHNNGMLWTSASSGLPYNHNYSTHIAAQCFAVSDSNIFVGIRNGGVFISKDIGKSWTEINYGLNTEAQFLAVNDSYIFTGSSTGGGVWRRSLKEVE